MFDNENRNINYLRISVTDRCNLRCMYCLGGKEVDYRKHTEILTYEEIIRLVKIFVSLGINNIKITGGEPLVRKDVTKLIKKIKEIDNVKTLTLTTNGILLHNYLEELNNSKIDGINISLASSNKRHYKDITNTDCFEKVLLGIKEAMLYPHIKVKINTVLIKFENDNNIKDIIKIASLAKDNNLDVRFIELMPVGIAKNFISQNANDILDILKKEFGECKSYNGKLGNGPASYYTFKNFVGKIGFITALSNCFCNECNRVRLTSFGYLKTCLNYNDGANLRDIMRIEKESDENIKEVIINTIKQKPKRHHFNLGHGKNENDKTMNEIGG